jgi:hypothetical protein
VTVVVKRFFSHAATKVFAGGETTIGTTSAPKLLKWTPDASTPDIVYYQCTAHAKLGWRIHVKDDWCDSKLPSGSLPCQLTAASLPTCGKFIPSDASHRSLALFVVVVALFVALLQ